MKEPSKLILIIERFLFRIGVLKKITISKNEMCKLAQKQCNRECAYCAWSEVEE